jgi:pimeloyl-ACP methyl ester carboxylesterase
MTTLDIQKVGPFEVRVWAEGSGSPVLFLHGYERHPGAAPFLQRLAQNHRVIAPELPGFGKSTGFEEIQDIHDIALYHRALIEALGLEQVDLIGHSLGGMLGAEVAIVAPHLVRKLVLVDAFGIWIDDQPALDPFGPADQVAAAKWAGEAPAEPPTIFEPEPDDPHAAMLFEVQNQAVSTKFMWPIADRGLRRRAKYISQPTLVVNGEKDGLITPAYANELASLIPNAKVEIIPGAGHYPMIENEDAFTAAVEGFLAD